MADQDSSGRIVVHMEGAREDGGDVRLSEFLDQLQSIRNILMSLTPKDPGLVVSYRVTHLSHNSPARVALRQQVEEDVTPEPLPKQERKFRLIPGGLYDTENLVVDRLREVQASTDSPPKYIRNVGDLKPYLDVAAPLEKHIERVIIEVGSNRVELTKSFPAHVKGLLGPDSKEIGTISGQLDTVKMHGRASSFEIFPVAANIKVECRFPKASMLDEVKRGLGRYVTVSGVVRFKHWDNLPYRIDADSITVHDTDSSPVHLADLRGIFSGMTGGLSTEDFIEGARDDED